MQICWSSPQSGVRNSGLFENEPQYLAACTYHKLHAADEHQAILQMTMCLPNTKAMHVSVVILSVFWTSVLEEQV